MSEERKLAKKNYHHGIRNDREQVSSRVKTIKMLTAMVSTSNLTPIPKIKFHFEYLLSLLICMPNQVSSSLGIIMA